MVISKLTNGMEYGFEVMAHDITGSTKTGANYPISNVVPNGVQEHCYLLLNSQMYCVL